MGFSDFIRDRINNAWDEGYPCLVGTAGNDGPNISPKGSLFLYDDDHIAYWERSKLKALENVRGDNRVVVFYSNFQAQRDGLLDSGFLRFYGVAELHEDGPVRDAIFARLSERESTHAGADTGIGVLVTIERALDVRGKPIPR